MRMALPPALRTDHAKAWAQCETDAERLDVYNGFLLSANPDALLGGYLASCDDEGSLLISGAVPTEERGRLGLDISQKLRWLDTRHQLSWLSTGRSAIGSSDRPASGARRHGTAN